MVRKSNMADMDVRLFSLCEAKFRPEHSVVGTSLNQPILGRRPSMVSAASEVDAKMAAVRRRRHPGRFELEPRLGPQKTVWRRTGPDSGAKKMSASRSRPPGEAVGLGKLDEAEERWRDVRTAQRTARESCDRFQSFDGLTALQGG